MIDQELPVIRVTLEDQGIERPNIKKFPKKERKPKTELPEGHPGLFQAAPSKKKRRRMAISKRFKRARKDLA